MHLRVAGVLSFCIVLWHCCNGQSIPEDLQKYDIPPPNMLGRETPTNKTIDQLIMEAMGSLKGALNIETINGGILMELDMVLSKQQYYSLYGQPNSTLIRNKRKAIRTLSRRWPNGEIPYRFYPGHFNQIDQDMVRQAMTEWERYTCLRFRKATSSDTNVIVFINHYGCYSQLGMVGGEQVVSLSFPRCRNKATYLHELGHVIGLVHEHQLPNRDYYVEIHFENVDPKYSNQFTRYTSQLVDQMNVPYDYSSIMHYGATAFSKDGVSKTIRVKYTGNEAIIGRVVELSSTDIEIVNKMYKCSGECKNLLSDNRSCDAWAKAGYCKTNQYMTMNCAKSCGNCYDQGPSTSRNVRLANAFVTTTTETPLINKVDEQAPADDPNAACQNKHNNSDECDLWAREGECDANPLSMIPNCQKSCRACDQPIPTQAPTTTPSPDIENEIQIWVIAVVAGPITVIVILVAVIIAMKRRVPRNEYEVPENRDALDRQSHIYMNLNLTSLT